MWSSEQPGQRACWAPSAATSAPLGGPHLTARAASACGSVVVQKEPKRKGMVFQVRAKGREGQRRVEKSMKGVQKPAVAPDKGSSDRAQGTIAVLCPDVLTPLMFRVALPVWMEAVPCVGKEAEPL